MQDVAGQGQQPRLPPEILEQIVRELALPCTYGDIIAASTLASCSLVSRTMRRWALDARYGVVVTPRHVRDFRRWCKKAQGEMQGHSRALFIALDDVSKLTSLSAGWEVEFLRLLQQQGPHLTHLSLWTSETRALLRDPAQIRGPRIRMKTLQDGETSLHVCEVMKDNARRRKNVARMLRRMRQGRLVQGEALSAVPLKTDYSKRSEAQTRAETAAAKERARQTLPKWLRDELDVANRASDAGNRNVSNSKSTASEIKRRYKAHIAAEAREYIHEQNAAREARQGMMARELAAIDALSITDVPHPTHRYGEDSSDEDEDVEIDWVCMPTKLSICPTLPLHEHEEPLNFARMSIWTRVRELDVFVAIPSEAPRCLELIASLVASPIEKIRFSSIYASLLVTLRGQTVTATSHKHQTSTLLQPEVNIAGGIQSILKSETLRSLLFYEFTGHHTDNIALLENAVANVIAGCHSSRLAVQEEVKVEAPAVFLTGRSNKREGGLASSLMSIKPHDQPITCQNEDVNVRILQGSQGHFGKLKDRRQDFLSRSLLTQADTWTQLSM